MNIRCLVLAAALISGPAIAQSSNTDVISFANSSAETVALVKQDGTFWLEPGITPEKAADIALQSLGGNQGDFCQENARTKPDYSYTYLIELQNSLNGEMWQIGLKPDGGVDYSGHITITRDEMDFFGALARRLACSGS